ncbi:MAG: LysR family transcriptional regulator [Pikeienuella sp.]
MMYNWDDLKTLIACAEAGSLSAAATLLNVSQPTLGRRLDALEAGLGVRLFTRSPRGMVLTATGQDMLAHAREVEAAAARLSLAATGRGEALEGVVRISASAVMATFRLPPIITRIIEAEPGVEIEVVASDATDNLLLREADIAIRMYRPEQPGLIARKVTEMGTGLFAAHSYLEKYGVPEMDGFEGHRMIGYDRSPVMHRAMTDLGVTPPPSFFRVRTDDQVANWHMTLAGAGIGATQSAIGNAEPGVVRVLPELALPRLPVWLTVHEEVRTSRLIRRVFDMLADEIGALE